MNTTQKPNAEVKFEIESKLEMHYFYNLLSMFSKYLTFLITNVLHQEVNIKKAFELKTLKPVLSERKEPQQMPY